MFCLFFTFKKVEINVLHYIWLEGEFNGISLFKIVTYYIMFCSTVKKIDFE